MENDSSILAQDFGGPVRFIDDRPDESLPSLPPGDYSNAKVIDPPPIAEPTDRATVKRPKPQRALLEKCFLILLAGGLGTICIVIAVAQFLDEWAFQQRSSPWLGVAYVTAVATAVIGIAFFTLRSLYRYRQLNEVSRLQQLCDSPARHHANRVRTELNEYLRSLESRDADPAIAAAINCVRSKFRMSCGDPSDDIAQLERFVLPVLDGKAAQVIETTALQVALGTAVASRLFDNLIIFVASVRMIGGVSQVYAGRPGVWGTIRLLRRGMATVLFGNVADFAAEEGLTAIGAGVWKKLAGRSAEGLANGVMMIRLGEAVRQQCRPIRSRQAGRNPIAHMWRLLTRVGGSVWARLFGT